ncbi:MAG: DUF4406 domain-containing protein [Flavobacteriaceae bacterium]
MNKSKIYVCGFDVIPSNKTETKGDVKVLSRLKNLRHQVITPEELEVAHLSWSDKLQKRIDLLKCSQAIYVLPNWNKDIISRIELTVAMDLKLPTFFHPVTNKEINQYLTTLDS